MSAREASSIAITSLRPCSTAGLSVPAACAGCPRPKWRLWSALPCACISKISTQSADRDLIREHVVRVEIKADQLVVELKAAASSGYPPNLVDNERPVVRIPWKKTPMKRRREIIVPASSSPHDRRPIRAETRATLIAAIARGRRWLAEIVAGTVTTVEQIAAQDKCSLRQVNMIMSLAFLAPKLVQAAVEGRLPCGIGVTRLRDAPAEWSRQYAMLGLWI